MDILELIEIADKRRDKDRAFLEEMRERLLKGIDMRDPTEVEFVMGMIEDWIDELKEGK